MTIQQLHFKQQIVSCHFRVCVIHVPVSIWPSHCATSRKVAGSIPNCVIGFFN